MTLTRLSLVPLFCLLLFCTTALAQGLAPRPGGMGQAPTKTDTKTGPAEAAEEDKEDQPDLPPLPPWPGQETKRLQLFQLKGYFRFRYDMFHNLNLGMYGGGGFVAPFHTPVAETRVINATADTPVSSLNCNARKSTDVPGGGDRELDDDSCPGKTLGGANMRLRLQPTINIGEQVRVHTLVDVFDNVVLGSTPAPSSVGEPTLFQDTQAAEAGTIVVKRAWAEVVTPVGPILFGRMPVHWGMGINANDGTCWDCDYGDTADRIMFKAKLAGYTLGMGYDFHASGPTSFTVQGSRLYGGQAVDLEQLDDVEQFFWILGRLDPEDVIKDRVDRGQLVLNYGLYLTWRKQDFDYDYAGLAGTDGEKADYAAELLERHGWTVTPDLWFKLLWKKLHVEFEGLIIAGSIGNVGSDIGEDDYSIFQYGWALRSSYKVLDDSLSFGLNMGMASGDQAEPANGDVDRRRYHPLGLNAPRPGSNVSTRIDRDGSLRELRFNFDHHVDLILFREILGTVSNAMYFKPWIQYLIVDSFGARLDALYAITHQPVGYPGNSRNLGVELDLDIFYRNVEEKFFAGLAYGVMFPLGALDRPESAVANGQRYNLFGSFSADAEVAHTLQARMIVKF